VTKTMTTSLCRMPSVQRVSGHSFVMGLFAAYDRAHNARLDSELYGQRWMAETAFSAIKRRVGPAVRPRAWCREFRELVLNAAVYNLEQTLKR